MSGHGSSATLEEGIEELAVFFLRRDDAFTLCFKSARLDLRGNNYHQRRDDGHVDGWCADLF